jgi:DNA-binding transcriptional regulator YdaS (Cro superfamily)
MIKNISTKELAKCIGTTEGFASQIKSGHRKLPPKYCVLVSTTFDISLHELRPDIYPQWIKPPLSDGIDCLINKEMKNS